ncbi:MAG: hypothetical protein COB67_05470 [SAR324 cluster bacterium]|uniref:Thiaminase-2/PQQC domain-containing protein n=1 Tax=SAR324 cluster bacterium TaxID=2024889 RepID=A0A2A4T6A7_9DELT|nr:MAG: hypothetical protein COB67_05470 [SAR324 cluster bacterium]
MVKRNKKGFEHFEERIQNELLSHTIINNNKYCQWFERTPLKSQEVRHFTQQFSVFSNLFLVAQLYKMINAVDLQEMRAAKEILANEIGCIFKPKHSESDESKQQRQLNPEDEGDPGLVNTEGTIDGGTFRFRAAHFEWLLNFAKPLGLTFQDLGKREHGTKSTLFFCDELIRIYGSHDFVQAAGASFAVENWAAAGFWKQLITGLKEFKSQQVPNLPLAFFTWHDKVEAQHKEHTHDELKDLYFSDYPFDEDQFIAAGIEMLDGVGVFWDGLNQDRLAVNGRD